MLQKCLEDLEKRINPEAEAQLMDAWVDFCEGRFEGGIFSPERTYAAPPSFEWPVISLNESLTSYEKMALQQLGSFSAGLKQEKSSGLLCVRANYGVGILPSVFGADIYVMDERMNTLPTSRPFDSTEKIAELVKKGRPDLRQGYGKKVLEMGGYYKRLLAPYPNLRRHVHVYHPDLQGPLDVCELLWGSELFVEVYLNPDLVKALLDLITDTYIAFLKEWFEIFPPSGPVSTHWGWAHRGTVALRDDSATNFSGDMYDEFARPYNERILKTFGGGIIHFCGKGTHFVDRLSQIRGLYGVNLSQPHLNDMETVFKNTLDKGIPLLSLDRTAAGLALETRAAKSLIHCPS